MQKIPAHQHSIDDIPVGQILGMVPQAVTPLANVVFVDAVNGDDGAGGIGTGVPYQTMQAAVDAVVAANAVPPLGRKGFTIIPGAWQQFDEDLTIDVSNALHLVIQAQGGWMLGDFSAGTWRPPAGVGRNLTFTGSAVTVDGIRPSVVINSTAMTPWNPTSHEAYSGARIAGSILVTGGGLPGNLEFAFEGEVYGEGQANAVDFGTTITSTYWREVRLKKPLVGAIGTNIFKGWDCRFQGKLTFASMGGFFGCELEDGVVCGGPGGVPPEGFFFCDLQGDYDCGGAGRLRLDLSSNTTFVANAATLSGGTTKTLLNDATP